MFIDYAQARALILHDRGEAIINADYPGSLYDAAELKRLAAGRRVLVHYRPRPLVVLEDSMSQTYAAARSYLTTHSDGEYDLIMGASISPPIELSPYVPRALEHFHPAFNAAALSANATASALRFKAGVLLAFSTPDHLAAAAVLEHAPGGTVIELPWLANAARDLGWSLPFTLTVSAPGQSSVGGAPVPPSTGLVPLDDLVTLRRHLLGSQGCTVIRLNSPLALTII